MLPQVRKNLENSMEYHQALAAEHWRRAQDAMPVRARRRINRAVEEGSGEEAPSDTEAALASPQPPASPQEILEAQVEDAPERSREDLYLARLHADTAMQLFEVLNQPDRPVIAEKREDRVVRKGARILPTGRSVVPSVIDTAMVRRGGSL